MSCGRACGQGAFKQRAFRQGAFKQGAFKQGARCLLLLMGMLLLLLSAPASAHEVRPAYLELNERTETSYEVLWKRPARVSAVLKLTPVFPEDCRQEGLSSYADPGALVARALLVCERPLAGRRIQIEGLSGTMVDLLAVVHLKSGEQHSLLLRGAEDSFEVAREPGSWEVLQSYVYLGFEHILGGIDHLLFVLGLLLILRRPKQLLVAITSFTVAHSVTLALSSLELVEVPQGPVEAVIALSIVFLALEILHARQAELGRDNAAGGSWVQRYPWSVTFVVGLIHGLGFAGALREVGLPGGEVPLALFSFNLGVELGQLSFVAAALTSGWVFRRLFAATSSAQRSAAASDESGKSEREPSRAPAIAAYALGTVASYWFIERTVALFVFS